MSHLAFGQRHRAGVHPALGVVGLTFALMGYHLVRAEPGTSGAVVLLGAAAVELLYFELEALESRVRSIEALLGAETRDLVT